MMSFSTVAVMLMGETCHAVASLPSPRYARPASYFSLGEAFGGAAFFGSVFMNTL